MTDAEAAVDALVTSLHPDVGATPGVRPRDVVLVTGPWLAGSTSLAAALRERLPDQAVVEAVPDDEAPVAVVFVTSAVAPLTESDCALLDAVAANTDLVIGAVSKIDVHRGWRGVLEANRAAVAAHDGRYADMEWVGVAAAPELGEPQVEELADALIEKLRQDQLRRRNRLRAWETRLQHAVRRHEDAAAGVGREARVVALRQERGDAVRRRRLARSERTIALRSRIQQAKVQLTYFVRNRCSSVRGELAEDAAEMTRRRLPEFEAYVGRRLDEIVEEVDAGIGTQLGDLALESGLTPPAGEPPPARPPMPAPPLASGGLEARLTMLLGAVFGLGVALTLSRLVADLAPAFTAAGLVAGVAVGLTVALWVVGMRRVLRDRAVLDRWVAEVVTDLRAILEQHVATRVLHAESVLSAEQAERDEAEAADLADRVAAIDSELREHAVAAARATARRDREMPALQRALEAVRAELADGAGSKARKRKLNRSCE